MRYLDVFTFPDDEAEVDFVTTVLRRCYTSYYPFRILPRHHFERIDFADVTILYGGNGTGKSTALHVIADKLRLAREAPFNHTSFFDDYLRLCTVKTCAPIPPESRIITSDDVFDHMLRLREMNEGIDARREDMFREYYQLRQGGFRLESMDDYDELKRINRARRHTQSRFIREELGMNARTFSNGESAFTYFTNQIGENALYLLDEPENSLSPARQQELVRFIADSARYFGCQFVIATHSPFLLALPGAKIYDLDRDPVDIAHWTELEHVRTYYDFFKKHARAFEPEDD